MSGSEDESDQCTQSDKVKSGKNVASNSLPEISRMKYESVYNKFMKWRKTKKLTSFSEIVLVAYFSELAKSVKPSTLWAHYSMLKNTINVNNDIDISAYSRLSALLKRLSTGFKSKQSSVLSLSDVQKFLNEAPDSQYLATKVALIFGVTGACRRDELCKITLKHINDDGSMALITLPSTKTNVQRSFTLVGEFYKIFKKYADLRPANTASNRFFLNYQNGKSTHQVIGINKFGNMPKQIALYLNLPDPDSFTGHSFRRTSATLLADSGADVTTSRKLAGWKLNPVSNNSMQICEQITESVHIQPSTLAANDSNVEEEAAENTFEIIDGDTYAELEVKQEIFTSDFGIWMSEPCNSSNSEIQSSLMGDVAAQQMQNEMEDDFSERIVPEVPEATLTTESRSQGQNTRQTAIHKHRNNHQKLNKRSKTSEIRDKTSKNLQFAEDKSSSIFRNDQPLVIDPTDFLRIVSAENLSADQLFTCDETGLYFKTLPTKAPSSFTVETERVTLLVCANASGSLKLPLMLVGQHEGEPRTDLPVFYRSQTRACMDSDLFEEWFEQLFVPRVSSFLAKRGLPAEALLLMDDAASHVSVKKLVRGKIRSVCLASAVQPMGQGVLEQLKRRYRRKLMSFVVETLDVEEVTLQRMMLWIIDAWREISDECIKKSWRKILPEKYFCEKGGEISDGEARVMCERLLTYFQKKPDLPVGDLMTLSRLRETAAFYEKRGVQ